MTEASHKSPRGRLFSATISPGSVALGLMSVFSMALLLRNAEIAMRYMGSGLRLCVTTVIPSLFPFMVLSELLIGFQGFRFAGRLLHRPVRALFGLGEDGTCALLLGMLCGFPVGIRCALTLYRSHRISREELERILLFGNVPSSAFIISAVGSSLFGSREFGIRLYVVTLLGAFLIGMIGHRLLRRQERKSASKPYIDPIPLSSEPAPHGIGIFPAAVGNSALAMLRICAFVVFFSALTGTLEYVTAALSLPNEANALLFSLFEMTCGTGRAAACASRFAPYLCAFAVGWSGLSVHFQLMSLCDRESLSFLPYCLAKLCHGVLSVLLLAGSQAILPVSFG